MKAKCYKNVSAAWGISPVPGAKEQKIAACGSACMGHPAMQRLPQAAIFSAFSAVSG
jgi:hypothetical protein